MRPEEITDKTAILCETKEEAIKLKEIFAGIGVNLIDNMVEFWDMYQEEMCYNFDTPGGEDDYKVMGYCFKDWYVENGYKVVGFYDLEVDEPIKIVHIPQMTMSEIMEFFGI